MDNMTSQTVLAPTVLVIDDDEGVRRLIAQELKREDFHVLEASNGHDGLAKAVELSPDIIVLDLIMPGMPGLEFLSRLKSAGRGGCAVVVVSGSLDEEVARTCREAGVRETIQKPFLLAELRESVRNATVLSV